MKKYLIAFLIITTALVAQDAAIAEKDVPKKVVAARNKKAAALKHKTAQWSKNAAGEYVVKRDIGESPVEGSEQSLTARFKEDGTWIETENVLDAYGEKLKKKMIPRNIQAACLKRGSEGPFMPGGVTLKETPQGKTVEANCGGKRVTFDAKAKVLKEE